MTPKSNPSRNFPPRTAVLALMGLAAGAPLFLTACNSQSAQAAATQVVVAPEVSVAEVLEREITNYREFTGRIEAVERVELRPRVSGYIESVAFREGAEVARGDVLFVIDPRPYEAALKRAQAELARAESALRQAQGEHERAVKLLALRALSQEEFDARTAGIEKARADVQAAHAAVDAAELDLSFTRVRAPIAGVVSRAEVTAGNFVAAGQTLLTRLVSIDPVYVRFEGDEAAYLQQAQLARANGATPNGAGQPVWVGLANEEGYPHQGELVFTDNELDAQTGTIRARARLSNRERIFTPGLFARVRLGEGATYHAILIDDRAVGTDQTRRFVYVVGPDNTVEFRQVELGPLHEGLRVVREGLSPGERIVVNGLMRVRPGITVSPQQVAMRLPASEQAERLLAGNRP
ncbi:MAG: efflux RND transporter periplasmic adaptor subunit [Pseudomonadota bacterium]|jgi:RND family efflux transporter MFP subunit|nr:MAG: efflux transporter periplasmic adaptor subunit [Pseudomonadota bacterium]